MNCQNCKNCKNRKISKEIAGVTGIGGNSMREISSSGTNYVLRQKKTMVLPPLKYELALLTDFGIRDC